MAIRSFANPALEAFFREGIVPRRAGWAGVHRTVTRKLDVLDHADRLTDVDSPPGNRLEPLRGDLRGLHSIRVNDQRRVVFRWTASGPSEVDVRDCH